MSIFVFRTTTSSCCTIIGNDCQMLAKFGKFGRIWSQGVLHGSSESFHSEKQRKNGCVLGSFIRKLIYFPSKYLMTISATLFFIHFRVFVKNHTQMKKESRVILPETLLLFTICVKPICRICILLPEIM